MQGRNGMRRHGLLQAGEVRESCALTCAREPRPHLQESCGLPSESCALNSKRAAPSHPGELRPRLRRAAPFGPGPGPGRAASTPHLCSRAAPSTDLSGDFPRTPPNIAPDRTEWHSSSRSSFSEEHKHTKSPRIATRKPRCEGVGCASPGGWVLSRSSIGSSGHTVERYRSTAKLKRNSWKRKQGGCCTDKTENMF